MSQLLRWESLQILTAAHGSAGTGGPVRTGAGSDKTPRFNHLMPSFVEAAPR
jgi:hypothetical protein